MMKWVVRALLLVVVVVLGFWAWRHFFPNPEAAIRKQLLEAAKLASFTSRESPLAKVANPQKLLDMCTDDIEIAVDVQGIERQTIAGKETLADRVRLARLGLPGLSVEFLDINVIMTPNNQGAIANLTAKIKIPGDREFYPQELKFTIKKVKGKWLIRKIETVRTLSSLNPL